jgi:alpha-glucosidase
MSLSEPLWWQAGVVYQIYPRSFADSNADGIGDLPGITGKLEYLVSLGVDAIWLSPFYPSPMADFGYDVADYQDVDPIFGTLVDFDHLVQAAHGRGLRIIIDFVPNHTSDLHPWFLESRSSRDNPKADWYVWRDPKPDGTPPNNWLSTFGGPAWEWDGARRQYYLHMFLKEQPDLNWRNPKVEAAMLDVLRFWLDRGVDGFRIDVAHMIMKDPELSDNPPNPLRANATRPFEMQLHIHDKAHPDIHEEFRTIRRALERYGKDRPRIAIGEIYEYEWPVWASYYGLSLDELHMPFNFALLDIPWTAGDIRRVVESVQTSIPPGAWPNYVLGNHDRPRVASRIGAAQARVAMMLLLTLRGTPTVYYGDELGQHDVPIPANRVQDTWALRDRSPGAGRDPERTPMQWNAGAHAGFCPTGVEPWLPVSDDHDVVNVESEDADSTSMLSLTRALLRIRSAERALNSGSYHPIADVPAAVYAYLREHSGQRFLIALNLGHEGVIADVREAGAGETILSTYLDRDGTIDPRALSLRSSEGVVIRLER